MNRTIVLTLIALAFAGFSSAQEQKDSAAPETKQSPPKITAAEAGKFVGKEAIVVGQVAHVRQTERVTQINFGPPYPNHTFTAVVFSRATNQFSDLGKLTGRTVEVRGRVDEYNGKPQIVLNSSNQLAIVQTSEKPKDGKPAEDKTPSAEPAK